MALETDRLSEAVDTLAPDGSEIRLLGIGARASMVHTTLPAGQVSTAIRHRNVEELWFVLQGQGEVWRRLGASEEVATLQAGVHLNLPVGTHFQFRNTGREPLVFVIATVPPWPGPDEAVPVKGPWRSSR